MVRAIVTAIGDKAFSGQEPMLILFGETVTESLKEHSIIQRFEGNPPPQLKAGDRLKIDNIFYIIEHVGSFSNANLSSIAHVTLIFSEMPKKDAIANGIYLSPYQLPNIQVGTTIDYLSGG